MRRLIVWLVKISWGMCGFELMRVNEDGDGW